MHIVNSYVHSSYKGDNEKEEDREQGGQLIQMLAWDSLCDPSQKRVAPANRPAAGPTGLCTV